jgi:hypothetical protein
MTHHAGAALHHSLHPRDPNPYFPHSTNGGYSSPNQAAQHRNLMPVTGRPASPSKAQVSTANAANPPSLRSASPTMAVDGFAPFAGTSTNDFPYAQHLQERFPFSNTEAHAATASCS